MLPDSSNILFAMPFNRGECSCCRRGGASARERQLDEEVSAKLGEANLKYASNEHEVAYWFSGIVAIGSVH